MARFGLGQAGRFVLGLLGMGLIAAAVSALAAPHGHYPAALLARLADVAKLDFGPSTMAGTSAAAELARRLPATLELLGAGFAFALVLGAPLGLALSSGRVLRAAAPLIQIVAAAPVFCAGLVLIYIAVKAFGWRDLSFTGTSLFDAAMSGDASALGHAFRVLVLPVAIVGGAGAACVNLAIRRALDEAAEQPYRRGLRLMGLPALDIDAFYVAPHVLARVLADLGEIARALIAAAVVVESVFGWPGAADLFVKSVALHDWNVVALILVLFAVIALAAELIGNLSAALLTPAERAP